MGYLSVAAHLAIQAGHVLARVLVMLWSLGFFNERPMPTLDHDAGQPSPQDRLLVDARQRLFIMQAHAPRPTSGIYPQSFSELDILRSLVQAQEATIRVLQSTTDALHAHLASLTEDAIRLEDENIQLERELDALCPERHQEEDVQEEDGLVPQEEDEPVETTSDVAAPFKRTAKGKLVSKWLSNVASPEDHDDPVDCAGPAPVSTEIWSPPTNAPTTMSRPTPGTRKRKLAPSPFAPFGGIKKVKIDRSSRA